jgi:holo-ACP synthase
MCDNELLDCINDKRHNVDEMKQCIKDELEKYLKNNEFKN